MPARGALMLCLFNHGLLVVAQAQFLPSLQANDPAEFDAYIAVVKSKDAAAEAERFERVWPKSELLPHVYEVAFEALRMRGDAAGAVREGRRALAAAPSNAPVAIALAGIYATTGDLSEADRLVGEAERVLATFRVPRTVPLAEWESRSKRMRARIAAVKGLVAFKRDRVGDAVALFEEAIRLSPEPSDHLRLGRLYQLQGRAAEAERELKLARDVH